MPTIRPFEKRLADRLVEVGVLQLAEAAALLERQSREGAGFLKLLQQCASVTEDDLLVALGHILDIRPVRIERCRIPEEVLALLPAEFCRKHKVLPVARLKNTLYLAMVDPLNIFVLDEVKMLTRLEVRPLIASEKAIAAKLASFDSHQMAALDEILSELTESTESADEVARLELHCDDIGGEADPGVLTNLSQRPPASLADTILAQAIKDDASEVQIEPSNEALRLSYRIEGQLVDKASTPKAIQNALIARLKIRSQLDIAERRAVQEGHFEVTLDGKRHEFYASFLPTEHGERCLLRRICKDVAPPIDLLHFTVTAPPVLRPGSAQTIDVWAHLAKQRREVIERAREEAGESIQIKTKGPARVARGSVLSVRLNFPDLTFDPPEDTILWDGQAGNATFIVRVPKTSRTGSLPGAAVIYTNGLQVCRLTFVLQIGTQTSATEPIATEMRRHRRAFASYASEDRDAVLARIQGLQKGAPDLDVFLDVARLRSGENWQAMLHRELLSRDVLYLFWSEAASRSHWVEWEWRCGLREHGIRFIDPVPLVSPERVPPPTELAGQLHFNDWVLAYMRNHATS